ncbi:MAG: hypothetical protein IKM10_08365 [Bacteroidaceae bacterium]|nr:hypothetical protein [Bacteroidaceae bacterium]
MMRNYKSLLRLGVLLVGLVSALNVSAAWEQIQKLPATQCVFVAPNGNLISSDFIFEHTGGIWCSQDKGTTWTKCDVDDYAYGVMVQAGDYIIAAGEGCNLARSKDNGVTWEVLNYGYMFLDYIGEEGVEWDVAYAMTYFKGKLFVADFSGGGVIYSEDFGETWTLTDRESLKYDVGGVKSTAKDAYALDSYYSLAESDGNLLLFGVYFIYRYNESDNTWELLRSDSNFMGVNTLYDGKLVCGRAITNYTDQVPFLEYTADGGKTWGVVARPEGMIDNNVRAIHSDEKGLYVGLQNGGLYFTDNFGESWSFISKGMPTMNDEGAYEIPMIITSDADYVYMAVYKEPWLQSDVSGVYRLAKSELPVAAVDKVKADAVVGYVFDNTLYINGVADVTIYTVSGVKVCAEEGCERVDLSGLADGVYVYEAVMDGNRITGKFAK